jgi:hypothetical protein
MKLHLLWMQMHLSRKTIVVLKKIGGAKGVEDCKAVVCLQFQVIVKQDNNEPMKLPPKS